MPGDTFQQFQLAKARFKHSAMTHPDIECGSSSAHFLHLRHGVLVQHVLTSGHEFHGNFADVKLQELSL